MATSVAITKVLPVYPKHVFLQWTIDSDAIGPFTIKVYRGGSPNDLSLIATLEDELFYRDYLTLEGANLGSIRREFYYKVVVTPSSPVTDYSSAVVDLSQEANTERLRLARRKLRRDFQVTMKITGIDLAVLKKKHFGVSCTDCYDANSRTVIVTDCGDCFGTRWEGGYHPAYLVRGQIINSPVQETIDLPEGKIESRQTRIKIPDFPKVDTEDIIVSIKDDRRFEVIQSLQTEIQLAPIHQSVVVSLLSPRDPRYRLAVLVNNPHLNFQLDAPTGLPA